VFREGPYRFFFFFREEIIDAWKRYFSYGVWIAYHHEEYFLDYDLFPWFRDAPAKAVLNGQEIAPGHFYWPDIDVDLDLERIQHPERVALIAKIGE